MIGEPLYILGATWVAFSVNQRAVRDARSTAIAVRFDLMKLRVAPKDFLATIRCTTPLVVPVVDQLAFNRTEAAVLVFGCGLHVLQHLEVEE